MVVEVDDLTVSLGDERLVDGVSFTLRAGEVAALVGESGSGKTTTGLALLGEHPPGAAVGGVVSVAGDDGGPGGDGGGNGGPGGGIGDDGGRSGDGEVSGRRSGDNGVSGGRSGGPGRRPVVGYIPQQPSSALNPVRRIGPVLEEMALRHLGAGTRSERRRSARERVLDALRRAQLPTEQQFLRRYPHQLSGGQQQRVVLAQALVCRPRVVVADEPTTGQDALARAQVVEELRILTAQGIAVLLLTHDLDVVRSLADQVLVMRDGRIVESGRTGQVLGAPEHEYTQRLVESQLSTEPSAHDDGAGEASRALVEVRGLDAGHRRTTTLENVSLEIGQGERVALVGRSGSGKTTLARCIAGLHQRRSGYIRLDGVDLPSRLRKRTREQLARIQYVFQDARASFNEFVPVLDQVARTAELLRGVERGNAQAEALEMLARVGLAESTVRRRPAALSGGELQRAALVRALLSGPALLICDEITSGLDTATQAGIVELLAELQQGAGCALLLITHDFGVVANLAGRVAVIDQGRIVEQGATAAVLTSPEHAATRALVAATAGAGEDAAAAGRTRG
ncbi:ABC transporter ATP-binding protein [Saccharopolyspora erythraea]|uniref:ABC transporter ATP-binding protein n=1 Tax=Saccharopolyspora erythraea TaxID=1836 RepID=UPI001BA9F6A8|nr:ABC transporter ATP-binding protein [Saccharopolyspora erythraea]QUH04728.1 ABC transporter ATP-binding protein [Saccharopolyspora erythraea]